MSPAAFGLLVAGSILVAVAALALVLLTLTQSRRSHRIQRRLTPASALVPELQEDLHGGVLESLAAHGRQMEQLVDTQRESGRLLVQAGWRSVQARTLFYAFQAACPILGVVAVLTLWLSGIEARGLVVLLYALAAVVISLLLPRWILRAAARRRQQRIKAEVPLFLHLLVLLFEAGLSTRQAIASFVREGRGVLPELGREFDLVLRQLEAGGDTVEVLRNLSEVLQVPDLNGVLGVLRQMDRYGGEVREPLIEALDVLEQRRGLDLRERVNLTSGRMTVVMVLFFFPALLIFVAGPAVVSILKALADVNA